MRRIAFFALFGAILLMLAPSASAHQAKTIGGGKFHVEIGWGDEPTYAGFKNSVQLLLNDANDKPITDLGDTLKVEVATGTQKMSFPIEPNFEVGGDGTPGDYRAWLVPTRPGTYTFHVTGTIKGTAIDETFTSSETTFDDVKSGTDVEFPVKDPSIGDLAQKVDRNDARATTAAKKAKDDTGSAKTLGLAAIFVGAIALGLGFVAIARKR